MVRFWKAKAPLTPDFAADFESQQQKLMRMSDEVVRRYQAELDDEVNDPQRLAAVYGSAFADAGSRKQAQVVAMMASSMLEVPNADVTLVWPDRQESIASVRDGLPADEWSSPIYDSWCKHVIATGRELAVPDGLDHPLVCDTSFARRGEIVSYLGVPVANRERIIVGVLCTHAPFQREWTTADVSMLTQLSIVLTRSMN